MKVVTPSGLCERLKINVSLARAACKYMADVSHYIYVCIDVLLGFILTYHVSIDILMHTGGQDGPRSCSQQAAHLHQGRLNVGLKRMMKMYS
jgi:hypothetical protein